jgi:hypothetical protein
VQLETGKGNHMKNRKSANPTEADMLFTICTKVGHEYVQLENYGVGDGNPQAVFCRRCGKTIKLEPK